MNDELEAGHLHRALEHLELHGNAVFHEREAGFVVVADPKKPRLVLDVVLRDEADVGIEVDVALRQGGRLVGADSLDQPVELVPDARLGSRTVGRLEQDFEGLVERGLGNVQQDNMNRLYTALGKFATAASA